MTADGAASHAGRETDPAAARSLAPARDSAPPGFPETADPVAYWARHAPDRLALVDRRGGRRFSYAELDALGDRWAGLLHGLGVRPGSRVGALARNRVELIALFLACGRIGAALVPYNWRLAAPELAEIVGDSAPSVVFFEEGVGELARAVAGAIESPSVWLDLDGEAADRLRAARSLEAHRRPDPEDPLLVLYTSGSTGRPKGALLPHRQIHYNAVATVTGWELGPDDIGPITTPLFHTGGWNIFATPLWHRGGRVVLLDEFEPAGFLAALAEERCTVAITVPTQLLLLQRCASWGMPLPSLRFFISGGAPCPPTVAAAVRAAGYRFKEGYGLTECGPNCFDISLEEAERKAGAVGRPVPFLRARLVDEDDRDVAAGEPGELLLRGPQLFAGYLADPERSEEALTADGWLRTGDIAVADADGVFAIAGRRKEMFISGGENVFPAQVEAVLAEAPGVAEVVVVGIPDETWGEVGCAFVVLEGGGGDPSSTDPDVRGRPRWPEDLPELRRFAVERLARYKVPKTFVAVEEIPRLGSGKPDRAALAARGHPAGS